MSARLGLDDPRAMRRGLLWAVGPSLGLWALAILLVVRACSGG